MSFQKPRIVDFFFNQRSITSDENGALGVRFDRSLERRKILSLAVTAENQNDFLRTESGQGGDNSADIGAFGIIDVIDVGGPENELNAVRLTLVLTQRAQDRVKRNSDGERQCGRGQCVHSVMQTADSERVHRNQ